MSLQKQIGSCMTDMLKRLGMLTVEQCTDVVCEP